MASQMDALKSFVYLTDNLPLWITKIQDLSAHTSQRHSEFAADYTRLLNNARPRKQKSPSMVSHRSNDRQSEELESTPRPERSSFSIARAINPLEAGNRYLFASAKRRRKTSGSSVRSGASGPQKFRQRHEVVIYYDGHVQDSFEDLVKNLSTARNNLRKGKKARMMARGPTLPSFLASAQFNTPPEGFKRNTMMSPININPKPTDTSDEPKFDEDAAFQQADKILEQAQTLCEVAAHQFLRDGDSSTELETSKLKLERVLEMAKSAVEKFKEEERAKEEEPEVEATEGEREEVGTALPHVQEVVSKLLQPSTGPSMIEVDDDSGDDTDGAEIDISRYRAMLRPSAART